MGCIKKREAIRNIADIVFLSFHKLLKIWIYKDKLSSYSFGSPAKAEDVKGASFHTSGSGGTTSASGSSGRGASVTIAGHHTAGSHGGSTASGVSQTGSQTIHRAFSGSPGAGGLKGSTISGGHTSYTGTSSFSAFAG